MEQKNERSIEELVVSEEKKIAADDRGRNAAKKEGLKLPMILLGVAIYSVGINFFLRPNHLYSGGLLGFAQLIEDLLGRAGIHFSYFDLSGVLYYLMNVPAILLAFKKMRRRFLVKTIFTVSMMSIMLALIPIPEQPLLPDVLTGSIIAGLICGAGTGIVLWMGSCDGGTTLIGMVLIALKGKSSIGHVSLIFNIALYGIMIFLFDIPTVIYSLVYVVFSSIATDKIHLQNINTQVMVLTKLPDTKDMEVEVMSRLYRGMTQLDGKGTFTGDELKILIIYVSKYEVGRLKSIIRSYDPQAFIIETDGVRIDGNFLRKVV